VSGVVEQSQIRPYVYAMLLDYISHSASIVVSRSDEWTGTREGRLGIDSKLAVS